VGKPPENLLSNYKAERFITAFNGMAITRQKHSGKKRLNCQKTCLELQNNLKPLGVFGRVDCPVELSRLAADPIYIF